MCFERKKLRTTAILAILYRIYGFNLIQILTTLVVKT